MAQNIKNTRWKYGTIPATERLSMLRKGNKDLYDEELSRTRDAIENRLAAGLDVSEQMKWGDTISYQYNLSQAEKAGENPENVAKTGYSKKLFSDLAVSDGEKTSTVEEPTKISSGSYRDSYKNESTDTIARATNDAYVSAINKRLLDISGQYNQYVSDVAKEYERQKKEALAAYEKSEKTARERELNEGRVGGGASETAKLLKKQELNDFLSELARKKNESIASAHSAAQEAVYKVGSTGLSELSDEFYRYNQLLQKDEETEYQKRRDAIEDDARYRELAAKIESENLDRDALYAYRAAQLAQEEKKNADSLALSQSELEFKKASDERDYAKWLKQFETDTALSYGELYRKQQSDRESAAYDRDKLALEAQKLEKSSQKSGEVEFGTLYASVLAEADHMKNASVYRGENRYAKKYSTQEVLEYIGRQDALTARERLRIIKELGLD